MRYSIGTSVPVFVTSLLCTAARSPSTLSLTYWIFSPPYSSILEMYERSRRSPKSFTNSSRSAGVRAAQCRPSERLAVSPKSKMSSAILRTATRLSFGLSFSVGSSSSLSTRSTCALSWSIGSLASVRGGPARASVTIRALVTRNLISHLAEDVFRQQLFEVDGRLHVADLSTGRNELLGAAGADPHVLLADETLGLDRRDRVFLQLDALVHAQLHARLIVVETDRVHAPDLDARDLHGRAGLDPTHRGKVYRHHVAAAAEKRHPAELDRKIRQGHDTEHHEQADD